MLSIFTSVPFELVILVTFIFGLIIGSFLNVYIYRFHTGKSLNGSSHCLSCGKSLQAYELVPLVSYLCLRGRCRTCHSYIPKRYFLVELLTGLLFVGVVLTVTNLFTLILLLLLVAILVVVAVYDLYHLIIPDELVLALLIVAFSEQLYFLITGMSALEFIYNLLAALLASLFFMLLWRISDGRWIGFGDAKLVVPLSILIGYAQVFSMLVMSFWIGAGVGLILLFLQRLLARGQFTLRLGGRQLTIKSAVPFAPFLILGFLSVLFFGVDVVSLLSYA